MIIMFFGPNFKIGKLQIPCEFRKIMNVLSFVVYYIYVGVNNFIFTVSHIHTINFECISQFSIINETHQSYI